MLFDSHSQAIYYTEMNLDELLSGEKKIQNKKLLHMIVANSIDLIAFLDIDGTYLYVSPSHLPILGYSSKDLLGKCLANIVHPEDLAILLQDWKKSLAGKFVENQEFRLRHKKGNWIIAEGSAQAILDKKGNPYLIVAKARDITQRKEIESNIVFLSEASKVLASSLDYEKTLQTVAKLATEHIAEWSVIDLLGANKKIEMVYLWHADPKKRQLGMEYRKKYPRSVDLPFGVGKTIRTGKPQIDMFEGTKKFEKAGKTKEYTRINRQMHITAQLCVPLIIHKEVIGALTFSSSESGKTFTKNNILYAQELANRAAIAIENARLYRQAQQVIASKDDFIAMVSHELKTPVTSLSIYAQVLQKKFIKKDQDAYEQITKMNNQLQQVTNLITELLDLSRLQRKKLTYNKNYFPIQPFLQETVATMQQTTTAHRILLQGRTKRQVFADKERVGQVLINLISNAIKYSRGTKDIIVHVKVVKDDLRIGIQDFGIGISQEHQKKIFERFYQVTDSIEKTFPGLGIGLYLSSEIIKEHQGKIWVESQRGKGSTFFFTLPLGKQDK